MSDNIINIKELNERIERESLFVDTLRSEMGKVIVGQQHLVDTLLIGLLSNGHILLEGVPGLAKTLAITTLAKAVDADFSRIQFTPDLLPADIVGTLIYSQKAEDFTVKKGPVFANFVLADEINRSPAKVQSALLEAMQERQVTIGDGTYKLPEPFLVLEQSLFRLTTLWTESPVSFPVVSSSVLLLLVLLLKCLAFFFLTSPFQTLTLVLDFRLVKKSREFRWKPELQQFS